MLIGLGMAFRVSTFIYLMLHDITLDELSHTSHILHTIKQSNTGDKEGQEMRLHSRRSWVSKLILCSQTVKLFHLLWEHEAN